MSHGFFTQSEQLFTQAQRLMPGGVSSPVRAFRHVGGTPVYMRAGQGAHMVDEEGRRLLDFCMAWGPLILGHAHPAVVSAVTQAAQAGLAFGTCHRLEVQMAELLLEAFPYADLVRLVVSGTEAVQTALRLARAHTGRRLIVKFSGCYHGHVDSMLAKAGSGLVTGGLPDSAGVTLASARETLVLPLGDEAALTALFEQQGAEIAAVIVEPLPANNGLLIQSHQWLARLRAVTQHSGALLIFDEVISGFRFGFHGYAKLCGVQPDLTTLGKVVGGGLPVAAVLGTRQVMERLAPLGDVYQAGTMAANPVALAAGYATLQILKHEPVYAHLSALSELLVRRVGELSARLNTPLQMASIGSLFWLYLGPGALPTTAESIDPAAIAHYRRHYHDWLQRGVYLAPSAYEVGFLSYAHTPDDIERLVAVLAETLQA